MNLFNNRSRKPANRPGSRSEQVRARKTQPPAPRTPVQRPEPGAQPPLRPSQIGVKPVTVRNASFGTPLRARVGNPNPRRQFYIPLTRPDTEMRLPAVPFIGIGPRLAGFLVAVLCMVGMYLMLYSPTFILTPPVVSGLERLSADDIQAAMGAFNLNAVEAQADVLEANIFRQYDIIESARVTIGFPNKLTVAVQERTPAFAWRNGESELWADARGYLFAPAGERPDLLTVHSAANPPVTYAPDKVQAIRDAEAKLASTAQIGADSRSYQLALKALDTARTNAGPQVISLDLLHAAQKLTEVLPVGTALVYSPDRGLGWQDAGGWDVYIGKDLSDFTQKINLYQHTIEQLTSQGITPAVVSVEYLENPYYRLER